MSSPFVAEIRIFPFNFAPRGWAFCAGQLMSISQNTALFSLIGTFYGGNGTSNFALPNLQGMAALGQGSGPGLSQYALGETGGTTTVTLLLSELPLHPHTVGAESSPLGGTVSPAGNIFNRPASGNLFTATSTPVQMNPQMVGLNGGSQAHNNLMPYLTLNYCIALQGIFPPRG